MIDTLLANQTRFQQPAIWEALALQKGKYIVMTLHRPANVDGETQLKAMLQALIENTEDVPLVFPVHPRTAKILEALGIDHPRLHTVAPLGYLEFNYLVQHALAVVTDSGGITEETTVMGIPCMTLRDNTERPETITIGTNELLGTRPDAIAPAMKKLFSGKWKKGGIPEKWDGKTAERIADLLEKLL